MLSIIMTNSATTAASKLGWKDGPPAPQTRVSSTLIDFWAAAALAADFPQSKLISIKHSQLKPHQEKSLQPRLSPLELVDLEMNWYLFSPDPLLRRCVWSPIVCSHARAAGKWFPIDV